jgi:hypothetical protein
MRDAITVKDPKWTLRLHEIEGHGYSFEASDGQGKFLGTFERVEVYRHATYEASGDEENLAPDLVIEAGDKR